MFQATQASLETIANKNDTNTSSSSSFQPSSLSSSNSGKQSCLWLSHYSNREQWLTDLDSENSPPTTLFLPRIETDVFIIEKPPSNDTLTKDPSSMKQKLSRFANGALVTSNLHTFLVEQAGLARSAGRGRSDLFQADGLHMTSKGFHFTTQTFLVVWKNVSEII